MWRLLLPLIALPVLAVSACGALLGVDDYNTSGGAGGGGGQGGHAGGAGSCTPEATSAMSVDWFVGLASGNGLGQHLAFAGDGTLVSAGRLWGDATGLPGGAKLTGQGLYFWSIDPSKAATNPARWSATLAGTGALGDEARVVVAPDGSTLLAADLTGGAASLGTLSVQAASGGGEDAVFGLIDPTGKPRWLVRFGRSQDQQLARVVVDPQGRPFIAFQQGGQSVALGGACGTLTGRGTVLARLSPKDGSCELAKLLATGEVSSLELAYSQPDATLVIGGAVGASDYFGGSKDARVFALKLGTDAFDPVWKNAVLFSAGPIDGAAYDDFAKPAFVATDACGAIFLAGTFGGQPPQIVIGGQTYAAKGRDAFLAKVDPSGAVAWAQVYPGASDLTVRSFAVGGGGRIAIGGDVTGAGGPDFGGGVLTGADTSERDAFAAVWVDGAKGPTHVFSQRFGDDDAMNEQMGLGVAVGPSGRVALTGQYFSSMRAKPGVGGNLPTVGGYSAFVIGLQP